MGLITEFYEVPAVAVDTFQTKGWALLRGVLPEDILTPHRDAIVRHTLAFSETRGVTPMDQRNTYGKAFIQYANLWQLHPDVAVFSLAKRFAKIAADLMGVPSVRMYHDQALFKEIGGGLTPWHQDQQYWPLDGAKCVTMWMPLVDCPKVMGTMHFASRSQALGYMGPLDISDSSQQRLEEIIAKNKFSVDEAGDMLAGDATFHNGWTIHGAPGNASDAVRAVMTIIYVESNATVTEPDHVSRVNDLKAWLPGLKPGDLVASPLNPILWP